MTFFQTVCLALFIQIDWKSSLSVLLQLTSNPSHLHNPPTGFPGTLGTASSPFLSLECLFEHTAEWPSSVRCFAFLLLIPITVTLILLIFALVCSLFERSLTVLSQRIKNALVAVLYVSFLPICHTSFRIMNCTAYEGEYLWVEDTDVICYRGAHAKLLYYLCVPLMGITVIVFPSCFMAFLLTHTQLGRTEHLRSWGLLFEAYKYKRRFWELTIFTRKFLLSAIFAFGYHYRLRVQCLMAIGVTVFFLLAHSITSPYEKPERMLAHMETLSLFGSFVVYFGACLVSAVPSGHEAICIILLVVMVLVILRLLAGLLEHVTRMIDWTLREFGRNEYYSKPWISRFWEVCRLKCSFVTTRVQRVVKRWTS